MSTTFAGVRIYGWEEAPEILTLTEAELVSIVDEVAAMMGSLPVTEVAVQLGKTTQQVRVDRGYTPSGHKCVSLGCAVRVTTDRASEAVSVDSQGRVGLDLGNGYMLMWYERVALSPLVSP